MAKNLVIVESPTKAKTISKYLGRSYKVMASKGHLRDLPKSRMGIAIEDNYEPEYITIRGKGPVIKEIKKEAKKAEHVYLASDPDREGEAIAYHLAYILGLDPNDPIRVTYNEVTKDAVKDAIKHPRAVNQQLVDAQQARRILDRLVGYNLSPMLWKKVKRGLSAGRVQSVTLKMIIDREKEIRNFKPEEYWTIDGKFKKGRQQFEANALRFKGKKLDLKNEKQTNEVLDALDSDEFTISKVDASERRRYPQKPFTTSSLQQEASKHLRFRTGKTMMIAQQLYEGIKIKSGSSQGLITYMRTDSTRISQGAAEQAAAVITEHYGKQYLGSQKQAKGKQGVQDAHEAIRPTDPSRLPKNIEQYLTKDQFKLYALIWSRFMASQMAPAVFDTVKADIEQNDVVFRANGSKIKFDGFLKAYSYSKDKDNILPELEVGDTVKSVKIDPKQHFTNPPARYTEASLIKALEELGVGRPSTYSPTVETLLKRYYVRLEARRFEPTDLGMIVNDLISEYFPEIVDPKFTAEMEDQLDKIESTDVKWQEIIDRYYQPFSKEVQKAEENIEKVEIKDEPAGFDCDVCGHPMVIKVGRYGKFYACSNFPDCRNTKPFVKEIGVTCPKCGKGQVVERKSKKNRLFYGCDRYPDCDFISWDKPVDRNCPKCEHFLVEKKKRGSKQVICPNGDYEEAVQRGDD